MSNEHDFAPSVPEHLAGYIVPATPADLHNNGNEIIDCSICYFEFSPSPADKETTTTTTTTTATATTTAPMEQAVPVKLALCGHVFCRSCILMHLNGHHQGPVPPCPMCRQPCYPQAAVANDTLSDVEVEIDDLEEVGSFMVEGVRAGGEGEEEEEDRGYILAFIGEDIFGMAEADVREEEIEEDEERVEEDEEMRDCEWEDEDDEDDEEDGDFEPKKEEEVEEEYEEDDEEIDLMELLE